MRPSPDPSSADPGLRFQEGRIHIKARRRGADAATLGHLALHLPQALVSLLIVAGLSAAVAALTGVPAWAWIAAWLLSSTFVFWPPVESVLARLVLGLHRPTPGELARLRPVWREVTTRAGVDCAAYTLWVEESASAAATAATGHIVGVTTYALEHLPEGQLAAALAHELGHHAGGHAWAGRLAYWYALPSRLAWRLLRVAVTRIGKRSTGTAAVLVLVLGAAALYAVVLTRGLILLILMAPFLIAAVGRSAELRADRYASGLGLEPQLTVLLTNMPGTDPDDEKSTGVTGFLSRLLAPHPDHRTRLHALRRGAPPFR
ncbi:M48 family metalloprotease [Streptomyces sp. NBC_01267]|uniref:M48 family metalloprotease n=1 Tax=unclassified Streptomyces TaxID=2593676 RepID=UPI002E32D2D3|nr:M48 family metalloprotease [Streptomyces sp. NBC_01267]